MPPMPLRWVTRPQPGCRYRHGVDGRCFYWCLAHAESVVRPVASATCAECVFARGELCEEARCPLIMADVDTLQALAQWPRLLPRCLK
jgi:hypothetical protein